MTKGCDSDGESYPSFAVTVDVVILSVVDRRLAGPARPARRRALPGDVGDPRRVQDGPTRRSTKPPPGSCSRRPASSAPRHLAQFGTYGDPGRDPRGNVVSVGYLAVTPEVGRARRRHRRRRGPAVARRRRARRRARARLRPPPHPHRRRRARPRKTSRTATSPPRSSARRSRSASCRASTRRSGASRSTPPTSAAAWPSTPPSPTSNRPASGPSPAPRAAADPSCSGPATPGPKAPP